MNYKSLKKISYKKMEQKINTYQNCYKEEYNQVLQKENFKITEIKKDVKLLSDTNYKFYKIKNTLITASDKIIKNMTISLSQFEYCTFKDLKFENCSFLGVSFLNSEFESVVFKKCKFDVYEYDYDFSSLITFFYKCKMNLNFFYTCKFNERIIIDHCIINLSYFNKSYISICFNKCYLSISFDKCSLPHMKIIQSYINKILLSRIKYMNSFNTFIDKPLNKRLMNMYSDEPKEEKKGLNKIIKNVAFYIFIDIKSCFKRLKRELYRLGLYRQRQRDYLRALSITYFQISKAYKKNMDMDLYSHYFYNGKIAERKSLSFGVEKIKSWIIFILIGYGEKPYNTLFISTVLIMLFAIFYMIFGLEVGDVHEYYTFEMFKSMSLVSLLKLFGDYLHFSIVTFTTVGYGNIVPIGFSKVLSGLEMILGVIMIALFTGSLFRKMTR